MVNLPILLTESYKMLKEDHETAIHTRLTYICNVFWKFKYKQNICEFTSENCKFL